MAAGVGIGLTVASGIMSARAQYAKGKAEQANHEYNAKVSENQAKQTQWEAEENARRSWKNNESQLSSARAQMANQGSVSTSGAPLAVMGEVASKLELGVKDSYRQASIQRQSLISDANVSRWQGDNAASAGKLMAISSLIGTAASAFGNMKTGQRSGALMGSSSSSGG